MVQQPVEQSMVQQPVQQMAQQPMGQTRLDQFPQQHVPPTDSNQQTLLPFQDNELKEQAHENELMNNKAEFFASTLMEKLGADTVYKMNPHQIAMVSAYTFLKLS
jgi:hypothetical protein